MKLVFRNGVLLKPRDYTFQTYVLDEPLRINTTLYSGDTIQVIDTKTDKRNVYEMKRIGTMTWKLVEVKS